MRSPFRLKIIPFFAVLICLQILMSWLFLRDALWIEIFINGQKRQIAAHSTLGEIAKHNKIDMVTGDLVDIEGQVLKRGAGQRAQALINGKAASLTATAEDGDSIYLAAGKDIVEGVMQDYSLHQTPRKTTGWREKPTDGTEEQRYMRVITRGALSGKVIQEMEVEPPQIYGRKDISIKPNAVTLCFDDGPDPRYTAKILDILKDKQAPATFFVLGMYAERFPELIRFIAAQGFEIGNHTYSHKPITKISLEVLDQEIVRTDNLISSLTGKKPTWFRPPQLLYNDAAAGVVESHDYNIVLGSIDPSDYLKPPATVIIETALKQAQTGSVIVLHDGGGDRSRTVEALPGLIDSLRAAGYQFVTIEGLFAQ